MRDVEQSQFLQFAKLVRWKISNGVHAEVQNLKVCQVVEGSSLNPQGLLVAGPHGEGLEVVEAPEGVGGDGLEVAAIEDEVVEVGEG